MIDREHHAQDDELRSLLFDAEDSAVIATISPHVDGCEACQQRLQALAASADQSREMMEWLSGYSSRPEMTPPESDFVNAATGSIDHEIEHLAPPSHPEMLGRLGRYDIERVIGKGGMGVVFKAHDGELNRPVAVKVLATHLARSPAARKRFEREARAAAAVVHEHIVAIHNVESNDRIPFLVMQYVAGESLQARVDRTGPLSVAEILRIGIQAASGLGAAHEQGIIHRDIKPANILLEEGVERVVLTDFGLARTVDDASLTQTGIVAGTPHYMSPEQANGDETDPRTDLFSLGAVLYFVATGHPPFRADRAMGVLHRICHDRQRPVWQINPEIPDELSDLIDKLLEKRPARRFGSALQLRDALLRMLQRLQSRSPSWPTRLRRSWREHSKPLLAGACILLVVVGALLWVHRPAGETDTTSPPTGNESPAAPADQITVDLLREVAPTERDRFGAGIKELDERLRKLEDGSSSEFQRSRGSDWDEHLQSIHQRLDRLQ